MTECYLGSRTIDLASWIWIANFEKYFTAYTHNVHVFNMKVEHVIQTVNRYWQLRSWDLTQLDLFLGGSLPVSRSRHPPVRWKRRFNAASTKFGLIYGKLFMETFAKKSTYVPAKPQMPFAGCIIPSITPSYLIYVGNLK